MQARSMVTGLLTVGLLTMVAAWLCWSSVAQALPEGRAYEMVSPIFKGGYGVRNLVGVAVAGSGEGDRAVFNSQGVFAETPNSEVFTTYYATREQAGWSTHATAVPSGLALDSAFSEASPALKTALFAGNPGENLGQAELVDTKPEFLLHDLAQPDTLSSYELAGLRLRQVSGEPFSLKGAKGASHDFCHIVFSVEMGQALLREAQGTKSLLYELSAGDSVAGCGEAPPSLKLVGVGNKVNALLNEPELLDRYCPTSLGGEDTLDSFEGNAFNAVSADGSEVFFQTNEDKPELCDGLGSNPSDPTILYVRLNGERTVLISKPIPTDCAPKSLCEGAPQARVAFTGANEFGSRVFFTTRQPLVTSDMDTGNDLYIARIGCPTANAGCAIAERKVTSLVQASRSVSSGEAAEVKGKVLTSPDGGRAYFVARGVLSGANSEGRSPVKGADNLYVYNVEGGSVVFVADLCSSGERSGEVNDLQCPAVLRAESPGRGAKNDVGLWTNWPEWQTTGDGRYLVFASYGQLVPNDTNTAKDVYRYDAQEDRLERVSSGASNDFNAELPPLDRDEGQFVSDFEMNYRAISEDGSRIVFETAEPLSPQAVNGLDNAYEWHKQPEWTQGRVMLVSRGTDQQAVGGEPDEVTITPSGRDIFFITVEGLLPLDADGARDVYDARLGGGFPRLAEGTHECEDEACQGALTNPAPLLVPGSVTQMPGENDSTPATRTTTVKRRIKKTAKVHRRKRAKKRLGLARRSTRGLKRGATGR